MIFQLFKPHNTDNLSSSRRNFSSLLALRAMAILAWCIAIAVAETWLEFHLPLVPLAIIIAMWVIFSLLSWWRINSATEIGEKTFLVQLIADIIILSMLLYFTGGPGNPFTMLYLLPLTIAAAVLAARYTWALTCLAIAGYSLLLILDNPDQHSEVMGHSNFVVHVLGMWLGFIFAAVLIAYFVGKMGNTIREHERILALAREQSLRDEHLVTLGTLAAGAAHELGTPLGSILITSMELGYELEHASPEVRTQLDILTGQARRCKDILAQLAMSAGQLQAEQGYSLVVDEYIQQVISDWQKIRPDTKVQAKFDGPQPAPIIIADKTLAQSIINVLNNAADASNEAVEISVNWSSHQLIIAVCDRGDLLAKHITENAGKLSFTTKPEGMGLGLFLASATIDRWGGQITLSPRNSGGACTKIELPLDRLLVGEH